MLLFCLPHAGAMGISYYRWKPLLDSKIEFIPVDLPGHNIGRKSKCIVDFDVAVNYLYEQIVNVLQDRKEDYVLFGHSLGALFVYELYYYFADSKQRQPKKLYLSGRTPPLACQDALCEKIMCMEDARIYLANNGLGFMDNKVDASLIAFYSKLLLADMCLMRSYKYCNHNLPILTDTTILFGKSDVSTPFNEIRKWSQLCKGRLSYAQIAGGHLFPIEHAFDVVSLINADMNQQ